MKELKMNSGMAFNVSLLAIAWIWLEGGWEKLGGTFVQGLGSTLEKFASKNPYPAVSDFLLNTAMPNSVLFGNLVVYGELFAAVAIGIYAVASMFGKKFSGMKYLGLAGFGSGALMSATFWLSAGWLSPSTAGLNLLMLVVEVVGFYLCLVGGEKE